MICVDEVSLLPQFGPNASGGLLSVSPLGLGLNVNSGEVDPAASTPGIYVVTNSIAANGGCASATNDFTIEILQMDDASFSYAQSSYMTTDPAPTLTITGLSGGTFTETTGNLVIDASTGELDLSASTVGGPYTVQYATNGPCPTTNTFAVTLTSNVSIEEQELIRIKVYPNPTNGIIYIDVDDKLLTQVQLFDTRGRLVITSNEAQIDLSNLDAAIYFLYIKLDGAMYTKRIVKE